LDQAIDCFTRAIEMDPDFAPAHAGLADGYSLQGFYGLGPPRVLLLRARDAAERAVALDDTLPEAHHALGMVHLFLDWDWDSIEREFARALALDPNASFSHGYYGLSLATMGRVEEAVREAEQTTALDPLSAWAFTVAADTYFLLRHYGRSIEKSHKAFGLDPNFPPASWILSLALSEVGRHGEAIEAAERGVTITGRIPFFVGVLGRALARAGRKDAARQMLEELKERSRQGDAHVPPDYLAMVYDGLGEVKAGIAMIERGLSEGSGGFVVSLASPVCDTLRGHPRFAEMLKRAGYTGPWLRPVEKDRT
jgi:tetratricopeptide (TPR) repeat protein